MCGICGTVYRDRQRPVDKKELERMCRIITHRGPDDEGYYVHQNAGLGMRRLSIIDLVSGAQPIYNEDRSCAIVFNGEIYNYPQLKKTLHAKGHRFYTHSDTEAIIHAYEEYGTACPAHLNGMFAFAIWDIRRQQLFIARDRMGIKPLYYYADPHRFCFGSELKSILQASDVPRRVDYKGLDNFLTFEYIPSCSCIFADIKKLLPAHYLVYKDGQVRTERYWDVSYRPIYRSDDQLASEFVEILSDAVKIRLMSDVPLGAFLSGGLDSSTIVALMNRASESTVKTFSIGFDDRTYNELPYARQVAQRFGTEHHEEFIRPNVVDLTEKLLHHLDEPFGDFSIFPTFLVSEMARKYVTVVLSGDGGDELLAGYDTYIADRLAQRYQKIPRLIRRGLIESVINRFPPTDKKKGLINRSKRFIEGLRLDDRLQHVRWMIFLQEAEKQQLYHPDFSAALRDESPYDFILQNFSRASSFARLDQQQYVDLFTYLVDDILVKVDRMSMATSLEARVPFLDYRFVEFAATIPDYQRLKGKVSKYALKRSMSGILPDSIIHRGKEGFSIPIKNWMKAELKPMMLDALSEQRIKESGFFDYSSVQSLIQQHLNGTENHSHRLWALMVFQIWYEQYIKT